MSELPSLLETCSKCGTDHEGWPDDTFGASLRCIRARAVNIGVGAGHLIDQADALQRNVNDRRDEALSRYFEEPS